LRSLGRSGCRGSRGSWEAKLTAAGREHLEPQRNPGRPAPRQANVSVTEELIGSVIGAGGAIRVPNDPGGVDYDKRATAARRHGKVPVGKELIVRGSSRVSSRSALTT